MSRLLVRGCEGQDVREVQDVLNFHIRRGEMLAVDGIFGPKTDARVRDFQQANGLKVDGKVGPETRAALFEATRIDIPIALYPRLQLTMPQFPSIPGLPSLPPALPPLMPSFLPPPSFLPGPAFSIGPDQSGALPPMAGPVTVFHLTLTTPTRKDPVDPAVQSRQVLVELVDELPLDAPIKALILAQIPDNKISPPGAGFSWGATPLFDPNKGFGVKGNAKFTVRVTKGGSDLPNIVVGAWGDLRTFLDLSMSQGKTEPQVSLQGQVLVGAQGTF
jgi:hypothetical protein